MPTRAHMTWQSEGAAVLNEMAVVHQQVGGHDRGRRYATQQINRAYATLLSSQFQAFCRDLHSECVEHLASATAPPGLQAVLRIEFLLHRKLDAGNPNPGNIGADFNRLGIEFWDEVRAHDRRSRVRMNYLEDLNHWRNAIAHQRFDPAIFPATNLRLATVRQWRSALEGLAESFDAVMRTHLQALTGSDPW